MIALPTALLLHVTRTGQHYDWLLGDPDVAASEPKGRLWTARVPLPSQQWKAAESFLLQPLPPHRRFYLRHQGEVSGGRGTVRRVDQGQVLPVLWRASRRVVDVQMRHFQGRLELIRLSQERWRAAVLG